MDNCNIILLLLSGSIVFPSIYLLCIKILSRQKCYALKEADIYVISERVVSTFQGLSASVCGAIIVYNCYDEIILHQHWLSNAYAVFGVSYFYYDIVAMSMTYWHIHPDVQDSSWLYVLFKLLLDRPLMMLHHLALPVIYLPIIVWWRHNLGDFFVGCFYLIELAIPFLSLRAVLLQLQLKDSTLYVVNGLLLILTWAVCRVLVFPFMYLAYGEQYNAPWWRVPAIIPMKCNIGCLLLVSLQIYWLYVMTKIAVKRLLSYLNISEDRLYDSLKIS